MRSKIARSSQIIIGGHGSLFARCWHSSSGEGAFASGLEGDVGERRGERVSVFLQAMGPQAFH